jgi:cytosine/adenosine deaminase-related metal-dependent hydrolase
MLDAKVNVGIGVDGTASNDSGHVLAEVRLALLCQRASGNINGDLRSLTHS